MALKYVSPLTYTTAKLETCSSGSPPCALPDMPASHSQHYHCNRRAALWDGDQGPGSCFSSDSKWLSDCEQVTVFAFDVPVPNPCHVTGYSPAAVCSHGSVGRGPGSSALVPRGGAQGAGNQRSCLESRGENPLPGSSVLRRLCADFCPGSYRVPAASRPGAIVGF